MMGRSGPLHGTDASELGTSESTRHGTAHRINHRRATAVQISLLRRSSCLVTTSAWTRLTGRLAAHRVGRWISIHLVSRGKTWTPSSGSMSARAGTRLTLLIV